VRVLASIGSWLPLLKDFLPSLVILEEKAVELYHFSLLEKPVSSYRTQDVVVGIAKGGKTFQRLHDHLTTKGFQRKIRKMGSQPNSMAYFRGDLGTLQFVCPQIKPNQKPTVQGLCAIPDRRVFLLLENPYAVHLPYLGHEYEVWIPQAGRFILDKGLRLSTGRGLDGERIYASSQDLLLILDLLVSNEELQEEVVNDFHEIRPPSLVREFVENLKQNGPGSVIWDSTQKLYQERYPESKIVTLTSWYWKFIPYVTRALKDARDES
jgi:hypothetical protein